MQTLQSQSTSNPSTISQAATLAALEGGTGFLIEWIDELRTCRDLVVDTVARCRGLRCDAPDGAFYAFVNCSGAIGANTPSGAVIATDLDFANYLLGRRMSARCTTARSAWRTMCGSRMLFRCPRCATRACASRPRVRR
ncbi:hypothetical protein CR51_41855 [Caballeronia megalochromosomata]|nr:hypothetical protein CR51_41855 [Caballeronia megalochromosomata]